MALSGCSLSVHIYISMQQNKTQMKRIHIYTLHASYNVTFLVNVSEHHLHNYRQCGLRLAFY